MIRNFKILFLIAGLFLLVSNQPGTGFRQIEQKTIVHTIQLEDPVKKDGQLEEYSLVELKDKKGQPYQYYLDVASVYCYDSVCKVVPVRIFWDGLGTYLKFELDSKFKLEKDKGKFFSRKDYKKLHTILQDRNSPFRGFSISDIMKTSDGEGVDAITSATTIVFPDSVTIKGATLTCYTLWHWVYGGVVPIIQNITGDAKSIEQFVFYLQSIDKDYRSFALKQIIRRKIYDAKIQNEVLLLATNCNREEQNVIIEYFEGASTSWYYSVMEKLIGTDCQSMRIKCLTSLLDSEYTVPDGFYEQLSNLLPDFESFQEIDIFLNILDKTNSVTFHVVEQVFRLLNNNNIIIARRVYWFLNERKLSESDQKKLTEFYKANSSYF